MSDKRIREHIEELASRKGGAHYLLLALEQNPLADDKCFEALSQLVDRVTFHEISVGEDARSELSTFLATRTSELPALLSAWRAAFLAAEASRDGMRLLLLRYPTWIRAVSEARIESFTTLLPIIAPDIGDLKDDGMKTLISILNGSSPGHDCRTLVDRLAAYQGTSGEIMLATALIADLSLKSNAPALFERMVAVMPPSKLMENKDARTLLPLISDISIDGGSLSRATRIAATGLCFTVAEYSFSSALYVAKKIKHLPEMHSDVLLSYLRAFDGIVTAIGISMVGFGSKELLERFQTAGMESTLLFVDQGLSVAKKYGKVAAQKFFDQKTAAARRAAQV